MASGKLFAGLQRLKGLLTILSSLLGVPVVGWQQDDERKYRQSADIKPSTNVLEKRLRFNK